MPRLDLIIGMVSLTLCCYSAVPSDKATCAKPPQIDIAILLGNWDEETYPHGHMAFYECHPGYIGRIKMACVDGKWVSLSNRQCKKPCTAKEKHMEENNIQLKWKADKKLYSRHGETIEFICKHGYEASPDTRMRTTCDQGNLEYPKCFKRGFCVLQQSAMTANNIHYNLSTVVDHGETILFQCNEGMMAENKLEAKCELGNINYPRCTAAQICKTPEIQNGFLKSEQQASYNSGSYVEFECNEGYVIDVTMKVKCENGQWSKLPVCYTTCRILQDDLDENNLELDEVHDNEVFYAEGEVIQFKCKSGFEYRGQPTGICSEQALRYPKCTESSMWLE